MTIRLAGAPISWGVCEVEGWGHQLDPPDRVLTEMRGAGLAATELGPDGFLPSDPHELTNTLARYDMTAVGGFVRCCSTIRIRTLSLLSAGGRSTHSSRRGGRR